MKFQTLLWKQNEINIKKMQKNNLKPFSDQIKHMSLNRFSSMSQVNKEEEGKLYALVIR